MYKVNQKRVYTIPEFPGSLLATFCSFHCAACLAPPRVLLNAGNTPRSKLEVAAGAFQEVRVKHTRYLC